MSKANDCLKTAIEKMKKTVESLTSATCSKSGDDSSDAYNTCWSLSFEKIEAAINSLDTRVKACSKIGKIEAAESVLTIDLISDFRDQVVQKATNIDLVNLIDSEFGNIETFILGLIPDLQTN